MSLDYQAMIYAAICTTPWRYANVARIENRMRLWYGQLGHMTVCEFRAAAIVAAQAQFEQLLGDSQSGAAT